MIDVKHPNREKVEATLLKFGGFYTFDDILERVMDGRMQSFAHKDSWVVTQISVYPRKRVLDIVFAFGNVDDLELIHSDVIGFARRLDIPLVAVQMGREGWEPYAKKNGWNRVGSVFFKEIGDGTENS